MFYDSTRGIVNNCSSSGNKVAGTQVCGVWPGSGESLRQIDAILT